MEFAVPTLFNFKLIFFYYGRRLNIVVAYKNVDQEQVQERKLLVRV
ncbi:MAG TPA: hypothetical protein QGI39_12250 [Gammaproteobacteria bacterium]|nr:hypothetical protein [Gammaproteobacteria bacterium]|tara:strand:- start:93 stop:230 length:138 start_codon:yes stop_codon:yes gene_type:complete